MPDLGWARPAARRIVHRCIEIGVAFLGIGRTIQWTRANVPPRAVRSILVVRLDLLGDMLFTVPLLRGVRDAYPEARLTVVALPYTARLAAGYEIADRVLELDSNLVRTPRGMVDPRVWIGYWRTIAAVRRERPDFAVSVAGKTASFVTLLSGARRTVGYASEAYRFSLSDALPGGRYAERKHEVEYVRRLSRSVGAIDAPRKLEARASPPAVRRVETLLGAAGIGPDDRIVVVHAGSVNGSAKRWPAARWGQFAVRVQDETGARIVLAGSASDASIAKDVQASCPTPLVSLVGATSVDELAALIQRSALVASGDSGPLHLAVAMRRPLVGVYGPTDPMVHGPYNPTAPVRLLRADLPCSPCYSMQGMAECPLGDAVCMKLVSVNDMVHAAVQLLC